MFRISKIIYTFLGAVAVCGAFLFAQPTHAMEPREFYNLARNYPGINAFAVTVQSAVETGHWKSYLWVNAYNGAGIKAQASWRSSGRPYIRVNSPESVGGKYIMRESFFRFYSSPEEFLQDYRLKILQDYPAARPAPITCGDISPVYIMAGWDPGRLTINIMKN